MDEILKIIKTIPELPGVYQFKDVNNQILYVGKAINLKKRVQSYFRKSAKNDSKTVVLARKIAKIEISHVTDEIDALLLETELIKKLNPPYNFRFKDDKNFRYIKITDTEFPAVSRATIINDKSSYFGPYPLSNTSKIIKDLRRLFPFRDCADTKFKRYRKLGRPCLFGNINLCPAPCVLSVSEKDYQKTIGRIKSFLSGKRGEVIADIESEMMESSITHNYEKASRLRDQLYRLKISRTSHRSKTEEHPYPSAADWKNLIEISLPEVKRIECYDIAHFSGKETVGSMVVFIDGQPAKQYYRRFKIKNNTASDDYAAIEEVLKRRLQGTKIGPYPDIILVDGGRGQVGTAVKVEMELGIDIPILGISKKQETIYRVNRFGVIEPISLSRRDIILKLLQRLRDEAHRFAQSYHHLLNKKSLYQ